MSSFLLLRTAVLSGVISVTQTTRTSNEYKTNVLNRPRYEKILTMHKELNLEYIEDMCESSNYRFITGIANYIYETQFKDIKNINIAGLNMYLFINNMLELIYNYNSTSTHGGVSVYITYVYISLNLCRLNEVSSLCYVMRSFFFNNVFRHYNNMYHYICNNCTKLILYHYCGSVTFGRSYRCLFNSARSLTLIVSTIIFLFSFIFFFFSFFLF